MTKYKNRLYFWGFIISLVGFLLLIHITYDPLLMTVGEKVERISNWSRVEHFYVADTASLKEKHEAIQQRSLENLVLEQAKEMNIHVQEKEVQQHFLQLAETKAERNEKLKEMNVTEAESLENIERAMIGMQVKNYITNQLVVTEQETRQFYETYKASFYIPELRTLQYIRTDNPIVEQEVEEHFNDETLYSDTLEGPRIYEGWKELASFQELASEVPRLIAEQMFQSSPHYVIGPIKHEEDTYWFRIEDIQQPVQQPYEKVKAKIYATLLYDKQKEYYGHWLENQKEHTNYELYLDNLTKPRLHAFFSDIPVNIRLIMKF
ncbi:peptidylprolyl isomerase [Bacillus sp. CGMCC 1.16541]|uniref:peptidylprolyl isomerase n=1 Tax=Bacillus sp. CGMCC 1.16541 TaxID=2185143 RepID=UPI000D738339|nr:peptidylprolyl isomerase [Bacillus sp. CGMCC 1.16541]